jgi:hypothetical protein
MTNASFILPILDLVIFGVIFGYLYRKAKNVKIEGFDYLWLKNIERKVRKRFQNLSLAERAVKIKDLFVILLEKFLLKIRIEALRIQVWVDKCLEQLKNSRNNKNLQ